MLATKKLWVPAAAGVALLGLTIFQVLNAHPPAAPASEPPPAARFPRSIAAEGRVVTYPGGEVMVGAERGGRLVRLLVREGQTVRKGELLGEVDSRELAAALAEAEARVGEAEAEVRLGEVTLARRADLVEQEVVARHDLDQARRDLDTSRARLETARAEAARYRVLLGKTRIEAPIGGTVTARHVDAGETLEVGDLVVTLADLDRLRIEGEADEADSGAIGLGAEVVITADGHPGRSWKGRVEEIADSVTPRKLKPQDPGRPSDTRVLAVKVAFGEPTPLKLGTTVELRIAAPPAEQARAEAR